LKKLKCKFCNDEFIVFGNLYFHVRSAHAKQYWQVVVPNVTRLNAKVKSYEFPTSEGMHGFHEQRNPSEHTQINRLLYG